MPLITVSLYPGRSDEQKKLFVQKNNRIRSRNSTNKT